MSTTTMHALFRLLSGKDEGWTQKETSIDSDTLLTGELPDACVVIREGVETYHL